MDKGYHKIFWGLIILSFHINLGPVKILPAFVGWLMILGGINILLQEHSTQSFEYAAKYSKVLVGLSIIGGILSLLVGAALDRSLLYIYFPIVIMILELLMASKILEGSIESLRFAGNEEMAAELENSQRNYIILFSISTIAITLALTFKNGTFTFISAIFALFIRFYLMGLISSLKKTYIKNIEEDYLN